MTPKFKKIYNIVIPEDWVASYFIRANNEEEAKQFVLDGIQNGTLETDALEYSCCDLDPNHWDITLVKELEE